MKKSFLGGVAGLRLAGTWAMRRRLILISVVALLLLLPGSIAVLRAATYADTFTEGAGAPALPSHTPDSGGSWTESEDTCTTTVNADAATDRAIPGGSVASCRIIETVSWTPASADYDVSLTLKALPGTADDPVAIMARMENASPPTYYYALLLTHNAGRVDIVKLSGGSRTSLANAAITIAANDVWKFELRGSTLTGYQNGVSRVTTSDSTITTADKVGIGFGAVGPTTTDDVANTWNVDDFTLIDAGTTRPCVIGGGIIGPGCIG